MACATNKVTPITTNDLQTIFPNEVGTLEKMVDDFLYPQLKDTQIPQITSLFKNALQQLPEQFVSCLKKDQAELLFSWYADGCIKHIQQDKRYSQISRHLQSYFREACFVEDRLKEILLYRIKILHTGVLEIAIGKAVGLHVESGFFMKG